MSETTNTEQSTTTSVAANAGAASAAAPAPQDNSASINTTAATASKADEGKTADSTELKLSIPDGSQLTAAHLEQFTSFAKEQGWSQEQAAKIWERENILAESVVAKAQADHEATITQWESQLKDDKELGGENLGKTSELTKRVMQKFGSPELIEALNQTGYGNFPPLVKFVYQLAKAAGADQWVVSNTQGATHKDPASVLYPTQS